MNDSELDQLVKHCSPAVTVPADFQRAVWYRIEAHDLAGWPGHAQIMLRRILGWLILPPVAVATCSVMVMVGAWLGWQSANIKPTGGEFAYIQSVSPFTNSHR